MTDCYNISIASLSLGFSNSLTSGSNRAISLFSTASDNVANSQYNIVNNCSIYNAPNGILMDTSSYNKVSSTEIRFIGTTASPYNYGCKITSTVTPGTTNAYSNVFEDVTIVGPVASAAPPYGNGFWCSTGAYTTYITRCNVLNACNYGAKLDGGNIYTRIADSGFGFCQYGIYVDLATKPWITNAYTDLNNYGLYVSPGFTTSNPGNTGCSLLVEELECTQNLYHGVYIGGSGGVTLENCRVGGNSIYSNGAYNGIQIASNVNNVIINNGVSKGNKFFSSYGDSSNPPTQGYGVYFAGSNTGCSVQNTDVSNNVSQRDLQNLSYGFGALISNLSGSQNLAVGQNALYTNTSGYGNVAVGANSLFSNTSGYFNLAVGELALNSNTSGHQNLAIGQGALQSNTTASNNLAIGEAAMVNCQTSPFNTAIGQAALNVLVDGNGGNTAIGEAAMGNVITNGGNLGSNNVAIGQSAMLGALNGQPAFANCYPDSNVAIGQSCGQYLTASTGNVLIGHSTLNNGLGNPVTASNNTIIGTVACTSNNITTSNNNIVIGAGANAPDDTGCWLVLGDSNFAGGYSGQPGGGHGAVYSSASSNTVNAKLRVRIGGTTYYILLSTSSS